MRRLQRELGVPTTREKIWLASYPRSGSTFLRCILHHAFGLPSTSFYGHDFGATPGRLADLVGHFELDALPATLRCTPDMPLMVKTHKLPGDAHRAIYIVRDPRPTLVSLREFGGRRRTLAAIIAGTPNFGSWSEHVRAWHPWARPGCLLIRYEDMVADLDPVLAALAAYLDRPVLKREIPSRAELAAANGRWVREYVDWRDQLTAQDLRLFATVHGEAMARLGYDADL